MKRRIIALILVMGLLAGMGVDGKMTLAAESTSTGQTKEIAKIEVVDTEIELPYKSTFTKENVVIKVTYEDATEQLVHPEKMTAVDTTKIGEQQLELSYQDKTINYTVRIVPRQVTGLKRKEITKKKAVIEWNALAESAEYEIFTSSKETSGFFTPEKYDKNQLRIYKFKRRTDSICENSCRCKWILWKRIRSPACGSAAW